jgi:hypothetical protein
LRQFWAWNHQRTIGVKEEDIGEDEQDKESNSKAPLKFEYISEDERRSENIANQQRDTIFNKWVKKKCKIKREKLRKKKLKNSYNYLAMD